MDRSQMKGPVVPKNRIQEKRIRTTKAERAAVPAVRANHKENPRREKERDLVKREARKDRANREARKAMAVTQAPKRAILLAAPREARRARTALPAQVPKVEMLVLQANQVQKPVQQVPRV
ncbi:hypothetical protein SH501x_000520 [Pirellulaceae bacterium SH501]